MKIKVSAVFDIGKTNKKFFLFDTDYHEVYREFINFDEIEDDDGYPAENLEALVQWIQEVFDRLLQSHLYEIQTLNFSCYGASFVHIDQKGEVLTPLYNYLKPMDADILDTFYRQYGPKEVFSRITGSPQLGMLNSGLQLYVLKYTKPQVFSKLKYSLHLPQYLSYRFTGVPVSEYTSIGCHTTLWDYEKKDYHDWVYKEKIDVLLPPITATNTLFPILIQGKKINVGIGIHDSSASLIPFIRTIKNSFILVSTGTWSISINPFSNHMLTDQDMRNGCLFNMQTDGRPVKVSRLFLGNEYEHQVAVLAAKYQVPLELHKRIAFDKDIFVKVRKESGPFFEWKHLVGDKKTPATNPLYWDYEHAYHRLVLELVELQVLNIKLVMGEQTIDQIYIDGGFADNEVFIKLLAFYLGEVKLFTTESPMGSALGAVIVLKDVTLKPALLKRNYVLKKQLSLKIR